MNLRVEEIQLNWKKAWTPFVSDKDKPLIDRIEAVIKGKDTTIDEAHKANLMELEELLFVWTYTLSPEDGLSMAGPIRYIWEPLFYANANDAVLYKLMEMEVRTYLAQWESEPTQYNKTLQLLEWAESIPVLTKRGLILGPSLKERLIHFLLTREIALRYSIDPDGGRTPKERKSPHEDKIIMQTNSTTLLLLFKILKVTKTIVPVNDSELCRFIAAHFGTEHKPMLSADSLRNKYKDFNEADVDTLKYIFKKANAYMEEIMADRFR
jgi:hypothetical protein